MNKKLVMMVAIAVCAGMLASPGRCWISLNPQKTPRTETLKGFGRDVEKNIQELKTNRDKDVRHEALSNLFELEDSRALEAVLQTALTKGEELQLRGMAMMMVAYRGGENMERLIAILEDAQQEPDTKAAVLFLMEDKTKEAQNKHADLITRLATYEPNLEVRRAAGRKLKDYPSRELMATLIRRMPSETDADNLSSLGIALRVSHQSEDKSIEPVMREWMAPGHRAELRRVAWLILDDIHMADKEAESREARVRLFLSYLGDADPEIRAGVAGSLHADGGRPDVAQVMKRLAEGGMEPKMVGAAFGALARVAAEREYVKALGLARLSSAATPYEVKHAIFDSHYSSDWLDQRHVDALRALSTDEGYTARFSKYPVTDWIADFERSVSKMTR